MQVNNLADITGDGSTHTVASATGQVYARWVRFTAISIASASSPARVGGQNVSSSEGAPLFAQGNIQFFPENTTDRMDLYDLGQMKYNVANSDKITVDYGL